LQKRNCGKMINKLVDFPEETILNLPKITILGNNRLIVENHRGIIEFTPQRIRINTPIGILNVCGNDMHINYIIPEEIMLEGDIAIVEFIK